MSDEVDPVQKSKQIMGGAFWEVSLKGMQENMKKQLEQQQNAPQLGQVLQQHLKPNSK
jgi:hypothetical protein